MDKMKIKYIEETFKRWFVFGRYIDFDMVDISDGNAEVLNGVSTEQAEKIIMERDLLIDVIIELIGNDYKKLEQIRQMLKQ